MQTEYKGVTITYNRDSNEFECEIRGKFHSLESVKHCETLIDHAVKKSDKPVRVDIPVFRIENDYGSHKPKMIAGVLTSFSEETQCWVVDLNGSRGKYNVRSVCLSTPENAKAFDEYCRLYAAAKDAETKAQEFKWKGFKNPVGPKE